MGFDTDTDDAPRFRSPAGNRRVVSIAIDDREALVRVDHITDDQATWPPAFMSGRSPDLGDGPSKVYRPRLGPDLDNLVAGYVRDAGSSTDETGEKASENGEVRAERDRLRERLASREKTLAATRARLDWRESQATSPPLQGEDYRTAALAAQPPPPRLSRGADVAHWRAQRRRGRSGSRPHREEATGDARVAIG